MQWVVQVEPVLFELPVTQQPRSAIPDVAWRHIPTDFSPGITFAIFFASDPLPSLTHTPASSWLEKLHPTPFFAVISRPPPPLVSHRNRPRPTCKPQQSRSRLTRSRLRSHLSCCAEILSLVACACATPSFPTRTVPRTTVWGCGYLGYLSLTRPIEN